jgi:transposase
MTAGLQRHSKSTGSPSDTVLYLALELSHDTWRLAFATGRGSASRQREVAARDIAALLGEIRLAKRKLRLASDAPVVSCYEAGRDGFWLHRRLVANGIENLVIDPASVAVNRRARRAKTDRLDAETLLRAMMARQRGERRVCSVVRVPTPEAEDARRLTREREALLKERIRHVNRIKSLCALQGIYDFEPLRPRAAERLDQLVTGDGQPFPRHLKAEIQRQLDRLEQVVHQIGEVEALRDGPASPLTEGVARLLGLRGLGPNIASVLQAEILGRRFANRREIAQFAGLAPSPWASGGMQREQGISKAGNRRVRTAMVELAWLWLRNQPDSALSRWFRERVGQARGIVRRIVIVAVARRLLVALWRYATDGVMPEGAVARS